MRNVLLIAALLISSFSAQARWVRANLYGADVRALAIDRINPDVIYLGTSQGEVYVSTDGASSWTNPRNGVPFPGYIVDNLAVDARNRLWAASWGLWGGGVIAVSDDGGINWVRRDKGLEEFSVRAIALDARDPDNLVVGGLTGVYRTTDAGRTWKKISDQINVESLAIDPKDSDRIYVGTWRQAFRTTDGGRNWQLINNGMVLDTDVFSINVDPENPKNLWASTCGWVYSSGDGGDSWTRFKEGFDNRRIHAIDVDPQNRSRVFAGSVAGLYESPDAGKTWKRITEESHVINAIALDLRRPNRIILGTEADGIYVSRDAGQSFARSSDGLYNVRIATLVADPEHRERLYAATYFGGNAAGLYVSRNGGSSWDRLNKTKLPQVLSLVIQPGAEARFLAGTEQGFFWSKDGAEWTPAEPATFPVRVDKILTYNKTRLFAATSDGVFTSKDAGRSWYRLAGSIGRVVDIAVGSVADKRALYALTAKGVAVYDGTVWSPVEGAPEMGRTLAIRRQSDGDVILVAGARGVSAGRISATKSWEPASAPKLTYAALHQSGRSEASPVVLSSREEEKLLIANGAADADWKTLSLPTKMVDIASVAPDPFNQVRLYLGTGGQGVYIWQDPGVRAQSAAPASRHSAGGSK